MPAFLTITNVLTGLTVLLSLAAFNNGQLLYSFSMRPTEIIKERQYYRMLTCGFLHADFQHLLFNMIAFWMFGKQVEFMFLYFFEDWGKTIYLLFYLSAIVVSVVPSLIKEKNNDNYTSLGASGGISAIIFASVLINPLGKIGMFPLPGIIWALIYITYETYAAKRAQDNINHDAHLWGAFYGMAFLIVAHPAVITDLLLKLKH